MFVPGGVDELREAIDDSHVQFALLRFSFGSGSFKRTKFVFITILSENVPAVKKGRVLTKKSTVKDSCGMTHVEIQLEDPSECTVDNIMSMVQRMIASDDNLGDFSISQMKADYEAMIKESGEGGGGKDILKRAGKRKTAKEMGSVDATRALDAVKSRMGPFNWALFKAKLPLELHDAGSMSVNEMTKTLKDDEVLFGLLRMGFGTGTFRRVKWIGLHWSGEKVSPVKRGQANAKAKDIQSQLEPYSVVVNASSEDECSLELIIDKVRRAIVVDGGDADQDENPYTLEEFYKALREEAAKHAAFFGDSEGGEEQKSVVSAVEELHRDGSGVNWVLLQFSS